MKKLIFLLVLGTALFASPCHAQSARRISPNMGTEASPDTIIADCTTQKAYRADYGTPWYPAGYAMWDLNLQEYAFCITVKNFNYNMSHYDISHWLYVGTEDDQDLSDLATTCANTNNI